MLAVDAEPETVREALERLALTDFATRALHAFGIADRLVLDPTVLTAAPGSDLVFGLVWRVEGPAQTLAPSDLEAFDTPGHVKVTWDLRARPSAAEGSHHDSRRPQNPWHRLYVDVRRRQGNGNAAKAAVVRKVLIACWQVLARNEAFKPAASSAAPIVPASSSSSLAA